MHSNSCSHTLAPSRPLLGAAAAIRPNTTDSPIVDRALVTDGCVHRGMHDCSCLPSAGQGVSLVFAESWGCTPDARPEATSSEIT